MKNLVNTLFKRQAEPKHIFTQQDEGEGIPLGNSGFKWNPKKHSTLLITGQPGTGKSVLSNEIFKNLEKMTDEYELIVINKEWIPGDELPTNPDLVRESHIIQYGEGWDKINTVLRTLYSELKYRVRDENGGKTPKRTIVHISGIFNDYDRHKELDALDVDTLLYLISQGRQVGVHFIIDTQSGDLPLIPRSILANITQKVVFKLSMESECDILGITDNYWRTVAKEVGTGKGILIKNSDELKHFSFSPS